jgi:signal transduction histidine kinase
MTRRTAANLAIRGGAIVALIALGLALALVAWQERLTSAVAGGPAPDPAVLAAIGDHLRYAIVLLLIGAAAIAMVAILVVRALPRTKSQSTDAAQAVTRGSSEDAPVDVAATSVLPVSLAHVGHLMSVGGLIRGFCHELTNQLGPVQGYAELLCDDARLSELHRRQVARIRDATRTALADVRSFAAALGWSNDPAHITRLGDMAAEAARSAEAALSAKIAVEVAPGAEVEVTATESEVGQAILHLCAAAVPLLGRQDTQILVVVDSVVGASSASGEDVAISGHRLEVWSDPVDPQRTKVQFGALRPSWRYGRVRIDFVGHGWDRELVGRMFDPAHAEEAASEAAAMALLGMLMTETGGVIMLDTCPNKQTTATLLWPTRIAPEVGAPLELDAHEDELDALIIHASETTAEELSRSLTGLGLRVASTTSTDVALDLVAEMGARCHAVVLAQSSDGDFAIRLENGGTGPRLFRFDALPDAAELERLAAELRRPETVG